MSYRKGPTEGGSGGKRDRSRMEHWDYTEAVKKAARRQRRADDKKTVKEGLGSRLAKEKHR